MAKTLRVKFEISSTEGDSFEGVDSIVEVDYACGKWRCRDFSEKETPDLVIIDYTLKGAILSWLRVNVDLGTKL